MGWAVDGAHWMVASRDGTRIAVTSAGTGPPLLLVHGGMTSSARWRPLWPHLTSRYHVTAMDRRGRGASGDADGYALDLEFHDVAAVAADLAARYGGPVDVFAHSIGAVCALGAAALGAPIRRLALYEPPGPETVPSDWLDRVAAMVAAGQSGRAMASFLIEIIGLAPETVFAMRDTPVAHESIDIVAATMRREAVALSRADLDGLAAGVPQPVLLVVGSDSPAWAHAISERLAATLPAARVVVLDGVGHEGVDTAPERVAAELATFLATAPRVG